MAYFKPQVCIGLFILTVFLSGSQNVEADESCSVPIPPISKIILSLSSRLVKGIEGQENYLFSPLSISAALAMIYIGTKGTTEQEMSNALQYYFEGERCLKRKLSEEFRTTFNYLANQNSDTLALQVVNGMFIHSDNVVSGDYTSRLQNYFNAAIEYVDFTTEGEQSLKVINDWIARATNGVIPQLLNEPLDPLTVLVLVNTVYFKGLWKHPFVVENGYNDTFLGTSGPQPVHFMLVDGSFNYYQDPATDHHFVELPYSSGNISMLLMLPNGTLPSFQLTSETLEQVVCNLEPIDATIALPKFKMEYRRELSKDVMNMGVNEVFSDRADLSGIRRENDLHVSLIVHKAVIEVDEAGTVAAAVSGVGIDARRKQTEHISLTFNHPFLFYIINRDLNLLLFSGRVASF